MAFAAVVSSAAALLAQEPERGGLRSPFCVDEPRCTDDSVLIVFDSGRSTYEGRSEPGTELTAHVALDAVSRGIQGWSLGVRHDPRALSIVPGSVTLDGTIVDPDSPESLANANSFQLARETSGGFVTTVVLSINGQESVELPPDERHRVVTASYRVEGDLDCAVLEIARLPLAANQDLFAAIQFTIDTMTRIPRELVHGTFSGARCAEICDDAVDNDLDGRTDCDDEACGGVEHCRVAEICGDGIDNDGDRRTDCRDSECAAEAECIPRENCQDGFDNDRDRLVDCEDPDCERVVACIPPEICDDGIDNDRDGRIDCLDAEDCRAATPCLEICDDGVDNDGNDRVDCDDPDCSDWRACLEICGDGMDNDSDGWIDCQDDECREHPQCPVRHRGRGGIVEVFCEGEGFSPCTDNTLEIVFETGTSSFELPEVDPAPTIPVQVVTETWTRRFQGWSYAVKHDDWHLSIVEDSVTTQGTIAHPDTPGAAAISPHFDSTQSLHSGFISAVVLSFLSDTELPYLERSAICRAEYRIERPIEEHGTLLEFASGEIGPEAGALTDVNFTIDGFSALPELFYHGVIRPARPAEPEICGDGFDNDRDGRIDCDDGDCRDDLACVERMAPHRFERGDVTGDGRVNVSDAYVLIRVAIGAVRPWLDCDAAHDVDADGDVTISDALPLLAWVYQRGEALPAPFLECGTSEACGQSSPSCP